MDEIPVETLFNESKSILGQKAKDLRGYTFGQKSRPKLLIVSVPYHNKRVNFGNSNYMIPAFNIPKKLLISDLFRVSYSTAARY